MRTPMKGPVATSTALVDLRALLATVSDATLLGDPGLITVLADYSCWLVHWDDWFERQPTRNHPTFTEWVAEGRELFDRHDALKATACRLLRHP